MARLPLLDRLVIEEPCAEDWNAMPGDRTRFCGSCKKSVTDLVSLDARESEAFLSRHRGQSLCVRIAVVALATGCGTQAPSAVPAPNEQPSPAGITTTAPNPSFDPPVVEPEAEAEAEAEPEPEPTQQPATSPPPTTKHKQSRVTMGCVCVPADPLCSCL